MVAAAAKPLPPRLGAALCRGEGVLSRSRRLPHLLGHSRETLHRFTAKRFCMREEL